MSAQPPASRPFLVLAEGLAEFSRRLQGEAGEMVEGLAGLGGPIPALAHGVLSALLEIFTWLDEQMEALRELVIYTDVALALIETLGELLASVDGLSLEGGPPGMEDLLTPLTTVAGAIGSLGEGINEFADMVDILPNPDELDAVRAALSPALGNELIEGEPGGRTLPGLLAVMN